MLQQNSRWLHFGFGATTTIDSLVVRWPMGLEETLYDVATNQRLMLVEGENAPACPADFDGSGLIGVEDMLVVLGAYGCSGLSCPGDFDGDGLVGSADILLFLAQFGEFCPD